MSSKLEWWAYLHTNGNVLLKRYFDKVDLQEADESPFVVRRTGSFEAINQHDAMIKANMALLGEG